MTGSKEPILVITSDAQINFLLERMLKSFNYTALLCQDRESALKILDTNFPALIIVSEQLKDGPGLTFAIELIRRFPATPVLLFVHQDTPELLKQAIQIGINDYLCLPLRAEDVLNAVQNSLTKAKQRRDWVLLETKRATASLQKRMDELEVLARLGRSITSSLDLDSVLSAVVDASVEMTGAEEGSLLLVDEVSGELYMRASRNFQEEFVRTFRLPINDTLAGSVITSGSPVLLDQNTPQKIKTAYLVHSLVYVPLQIQGHVFGVLGVDNRDNRSPFKDHDVKLLTTLAEYAVVAIENARLYSNTNSERNKLETILTRIQDGVIVVDQDLRFALVNQTAQAALNLPENNLKNKPVRDLISQPEILELLDTSGKRLSNRAEMTVEDGRVFSVQMTPIPDVGFVLTLHDITNLKKLDRIKNDFVNTVSHDLRSPLTAILGYVELIDRAGPVTDLQRDFIRRVQNSVHSITKLVDDLVNLGRIEAGFDARKEAIYLPEIIQYSVEGYKNAIKAKNQQVDMEAPKDMVPIFGNPVQMRQLVDHLLDNAIKYTPQNGSITLHLETEENQIILQCRDSGAGIPPADLPYIFDKFYRASNVITDISGSGLGLAVVRSIVEGHQGRVWVDSRLGEGSIFTVVLPLADQTIEQILPEKS
jgi:two-component system NtrC family sensor kinase